MAEDSGQHLEGRLVQVQGLAGDLHLEGRLVLVQGLAGDLRKCSVARQLCVLSLSLS